MTPVAYDSNQNAILDMKSGRLDGVFGNTAVVNQWLKTNSDLRHQARHCGAQRQRRAAAA
nr:23S rRNA (uracil(747)-C(5))-methyltransferase [Candidatus Pantoea persica]